MTTQEEISNRLYKLMEERDMLQADVAKAAGLTRQHFNDILKCRKYIRLEHIIKICTALKCDPNELFGWKKKNHQITVTDDNGEVIALITDNSVVEHKGFHVLLA